MSLGELETLIRAILDHAYFGVAVGCTLVCIHAFFKNKEIFNIVMRSSFMSALLVWLLLVVLVIVFVYIVFDVDNSRQGVAVGLGITSTLLNISKDKDFYNEN